jgi:hypothetical protein
MLKCPRCATELREVLPGPKWLRHFVCDECWRGYSYSWRMGRPRIPAGKRRARGTIEWYLTPGVEDRYASTNVQTSGTRIQNQRV